MPGPSVGVRRTRSGLKWGPLATLPAVPYALAMVERRGLGWPNVHALPFARNTVK
jgi:hypothetical protein